MTVFVLDTNVISDMMAPTPVQNVIANIDFHRQDTICICEAVDYEIRRGFLKANATGRLRSFEQRIKPQFQWLQIIEPDWQHAARLWADAANRGKALSDVDLLIAAIATRLGGVVVSADEDFDELRIERQDWRLK